MQPQKDRTFSSSATESSCAEIKSTSTAPAVLVFNETENKVNQNTYKLSTEAKPFIPSFMRSVDPPTQILEVSDKGHNDDTQPMPIGSECVDSCQIAPPLNSQKGSLPQTIKAKCNTKKRKNKVNSSKPQERGDSATNRDLRAHFDLWASHLVNMSEDEVHLLIDCLPEDIQHLYYHHLSHFADTQQQGATSSKEKHIVASQGSPSLSPAVSAAFSTFNEISEETLRYIEQLLCLESLSDYEGGDEMPEESLFVNPDEGLDSEEEEWLLEQIMSVDSIPVESGFIKPDQSQNERGQHTSSKKVDGEDSNKGKHAKHRSRR